MSSRYSIFDLEKEADGARNDRRVRHRSPVGPGDSSRRLSFSPHLKDLCGVRRLGKAPHGVLMPRIERLL